MIWGWGFFIACVWRDIIYWSYLWIPPLSATVVWNNLAFDCCLHIVISNMSLADWISLFQIPTKWGARKRFGLLTELCCLKQDLQRLSSNLIALKVKFFSLIGNSIHRKKLLLDISLSQHNSSDGQLETVCVFSQTSRWPALVTRQMMRHKSCFFFHFFQPYVSCAWCREVQRKPILFKKNIDLVSLQIWNLECRGSVLSSPVSEIQASTSYNLKIVHVVYLK